MSTLLYQVQDLEFNYVWNAQKIPVLRRVQLSLNTGCFCCFVGPSGTGKTTLLNLLGLIDLPTSGKLVFCNQDLSTSSESDRESIRLHKIGFIFQSFYLIPTLSVLENTSYFLPLLGQSKKQAEKTASEILDLLGLSDHFHKKPSQLSGGQRQRVAIARAIAKKPKVVLADEPTANLDSETADKTINAFLEIQKSEGTSFIFSTHDSKLVNYARSIYPMKDGAILSAVEKQ